MKNKNLLIVLILLSITACGNKENKSQTDTPTVNIKDEITENIDTTPYDNMLTEEKNILLIESVKTGQLEEVKALIESGALINSTDQYGSTTLMVASEEGHANVVKYLIDISLSKTNAIDLNRGDEGWGYRQLFGLQLMGI